MLDKFPVTQGLYFEVTGQKPSTFISNEKPVETVSWMEAVIFCNQLLQRSRFAALLQLY